MKDPNNQQSPPYTAIPVEDDVRPSAPPAYVHGYQQTNGQPAYLVQPTVIIAEPAEPLIPIGLVLFAIGFFFPICWFLGSCIPSIPRTRSEHTWLKVNRIMTCLCIFITVLFIMLWLLIAAGAMASSV